MAPLTQRPPTRRAHRRTDFRLPPGYVPTSVEPLFSQRYDGMGEQNGLIVPFLACGDLRGYDADQNYPLLLADDLPPMTAAQRVDVLYAEPGAGVASASRAAGGGATYTYHEPTQKPTHPAYKAALEEQARRDNRKLCFAEPPPPEPPVSGHFFYLGRRD